MATEIERKFLVDGDFLQYMISATRITQGYLCTDPGKTVRIRHAVGIATQGFITVKGLSSVDGLVRPEWEYNIPPIDALEMLALPNVPQLSKIRYDVPFADAMWSVDVFLGRNKGKVIAEIETPTIDTVVVLPDWVGEEVTGDVRYYNSSMLHTG